MSDQSVRQTARRTALQAQKSRRGERRAQEKRWDAFAVDVCVALAQRDGWVTECEQRAGQALVAMTRPGGLRLREAVHRCGQGLTVREASRLRQLCPVPVPDELGDEVDRDVPGDPGPPAEQDGAVEDPGTADHV